MTQEDVETIWIRKREFRHFRQLVIRERWDWDAAFSCNERREIWAFVTRGYTQLPERVMVRGASRLLDDVAESYLRFRPGGGRFFIDRRGAFCKEEGQEQFLRFERYGK